MKQRPTRNWIVVAVLTATAGFLALQGNGEPAATVTPTVAFTVAPTETPADEGCAFIWAYHDHPELTRKLDESVRAIEPASSANVNLFGEDCVYAGGRSTFTVKETDFYIHLPVNDLSDGERFGNWMAEILSVIVAIPREEIQGSYGFAEFWFEKTAVENVLVRVPIQQYIEEGVGKSGVELFRMFSSAP